MLKRISRVAVLAASACINTADNLGNTEGDPGTDPGTGDAGLVCSAPSDPMKQTLCGQLYDFETNAKLGGASGTLAITVYNAIDFAQSGPDRPRLTHGGVEIDGSGRFRIKDIDLAAAGPFIALAIDDAAGFGLSGNLVTTAVATRSRAGTATDQIEAWAVKASTAVQWAASGSFDLAQGAFVPVFRAHMLAHPGRTHSQRRAA